MSQTPIFDELMRLHNLCRTRVDPLIVLHEDRVSSPDPVSQFAEAMKAITERLKDSERTAGSVIKEVVDEFQKKPRMNGVRPSLSIMDEWVDTDQPQYLDTQDLKENAS